MAVVQGTAGPDTLFGGPDADQISGLAGDDVLFGDGGDDLLNGGTGFDSLDGGPGFDSGELDWSGSFAGGDGLTFVYDSASASPFTAAQFMGRRSASSNSDYRFGW